MNRASHGAKTTGWRSNRWVGRAGLAAIVLVVAVVTAVAVGAAIDLVAKFL